MNAVCFVPPPPPPPLDVVPEAISRCSSFVRSFVRPSVRIFGHRNATFSDDWQALPHSLPPSMNCSSRTAFPLPPLRPFILLSLVLFPSLTSAYYFVLTRYSPLRATSLRFLPSISSRTSEEREWAVGMSTLGGEDSQFGWDANWGKQYLPNRRDDVGMEGKKRSVGSVKTLPGHEHVCTMIIRTDHRPEFGHEQNGTRMEVQQDEHRQFSATFVECANTMRGNCHGIDNKIFSSECVTLFEFRPAAVRVEGNSRAFEEGFIRVPIACQCRLRRKIGHGIYSS